ncbi:MAG: hypothetical protein ABSA82_11430, partial [Thermacetogeniaceae bacterium]
ANARPEECGAQAHPGLQPGLKNAEYMKRWAPVSGLTPGLKENGHTGKSGYVPGLTSSKLQWGKASPH